MSKKFAKKKATRLKRSAPKQVALALDATLAGGDVGFAYMRRTLLRTSLNEPGRATTGGVLYVKGRTRAKPVFVVVSERNFGGAELAAVLSAHRSNIFRTPWATLSRTIETRVARHVIEEMVGVQGSSLLQAKQIALADWVVSKRRKAASLYSETWAQDAALRKLCALGLNALRPAQLPDEQFSSRETIIAYLLAGMVWHQILRERESR